MRYDIIGDIHGHADPLEILLQKLGYERRNGIYTHTENRKVIFVGDFVDRGPKIRETLHIVKDMCDAGHAEAVMGNHEFNAISFHTVHTENGGFFRNHTIEEIEQHLETMRQFRHYQNEWKVFLEWFKKLPLYLDKGTFRVVHACWDSAQVNYLKKNFEGVNEEFLRMTNDKANSNEMYKVVSDMLKGKEYELPKGYYFFDKGGVMRTECRIKWWKKVQEETTFGDMLFDCPENLSSAHFSDDDPLYHYQENIPVFFGHYWLKGMPKVENPNAICLDYSVAKEGKLVAASIDSENTTSDVRFTYVLAKA